MEKFSISLPSMFGDHHVTEVRRILGALPGVVEIYASSGFQLIELEFDPGKTSPELIQDALQQHGYIEEALAPVEIHKDPSDLEGEKPYFRHTASIHNIKKTISFQQDVVAASRPMWPCPGLTPLKEVEKEVEHG